MVISKSNAQKIMGLAHDHPHVSSFEDLVKKRFTVRLFSETLVDNSSFEAAFSSTMRSWLKIDNLEARWPKLFQKSLKEIKEEDFEATGIHSPPLKAEILRLKYSNLEETEYYTGIKFFRKSLMEKEGLRDQEKGVHWTQDKSALKKLSLLNQNSSSPPVSEINEELLNIISSDGKSDVPISDLFVYLERYLKKLGPMPGTTQQLLVSCQRGVSIESRLKAITEQGKSRDKSKFEKACIDLKELAKDTSAKISSMECGDRTVVFGGCLPKKAKINFDKLPMGLFSFLDFSTSWDIRNYLSDKQHAFLIAHKIVRSFKSLAKENDFQVDTKWILKLIHDGLIDSISPKIRQSYWKKEQTLWQKFKTAPQEMGRRGLHYLLESYNKKIVDLIIENLPSKLVEDLSHILKTENADNLEAKICEKINSYLLDFLESSHDFIVGQIGQIISGLPSNIKLLIRMTGFGDPGESEGAKVWFEIRKDTTQKFSLAVFTTGEALNYHPSIDTPNGKKFQIPFVFKDITKAQLDTEFFFRFLSYSPFSEWGKESHTVKDIYEGLLHSFTPSEGPPQEKECFSKEKVSGGTWGLFKNLLRVRLSLDAKKEEAFYFNLQKQAFLDLWSHVGENLEVLEEKTSLRSAIRSSAESLMQKALKMHEQNNLSQEELKIIFATTWEALEATNENETVLKQTPTSQIIPHEIKVKLHSLLASYKDSFYIEIFKNICVAVLGEQVSAVFDEIEKELAVSVLEKVASPSTLKQRIWKVIKMDGSTLASRAYRIGYIAFGILSAKSSTNALIFFVAQHIFRHYVAPNSVKSFIRFTHKYVAQAIAQLFLSQDIVRELNYLIQEWQAYLFHAGKIDYLLPEGISSSKDIVLKWNTLEITPRASPIADTTNAAVYLNPEHLKLTEENTCDRLQELINKSKLIGYHPAKRLYLTEQIEKLPVPEKEGNGCWGQDPDYHQILERISQLTFEYAQLQNKDYISLELDQKFVINIFKLYAITDKLARRCPDSHLEGFQANPWPILLWKQNAAHRIVSLETQQQLKQIVEYFGLDPKKRYTEKEVRSLSQNSLFSDNEDGESCVEINSTTCGSAEDTRYFNLLLQDPATRKKLTALGYDPDQSSKISLFTELYMDKVYDKDSLEKTLGKPISSEEYQELSKILNPQGTNLRNSILPRSFYHLRLLNYLSQNALIGERNVRFENINSLSMEISNKGNTVNESLATLPLIGRYFKAMKRTDHFNVDRPGNYTVVSCGMNYNHLSKDHYNKGKSWIRRKDEISMGVEYQGIFENHLNHPLRRQQNAIDNDPPTFKEKRSDSFLQKVKKSLLNFLAGERKKLGSLDLLSDKEKILFEMIFSVRSEQVSRTISFFSQRMNWFVNINFFHICDILLFEGDLLHEQLKTHPDFALTLGDFFKKGLEAYPLNKNASAAAQFVRMGTIAKAICENLQLNTEHFPNFREILRNEELLSHEVEPGIKTQTIIKDLLSLPYTLQDPAKASQDTIRKAVEDLCWDGFCFKSTSSSNYSSQYHEGILAWEFYIAKYLDMPENAAFRNKVFTELLIRREMIPAKSIPMEFKGDYPYYQSGRFNLCLKDDELSGTTIFTFDDALKEAIKSKLATISPESNYDIVEIKGEFYSKKLGIFAEVTNDGQKDNILLYRYQDAKKYYHVINKNKNIPYESYWLSDPDSSGMRELLTYKSNQMHKTEIIYSGNSEHLQDYQILSQPLERIEKEGIPLDMVEFTKQKHGLHLLGWFQPLSSIQCFHDPKHKFLVKKIVFKNLDLQFKTQKVNNKWEAINDDKIPGFFIAKNQRLDSLSKYTKYLLLENSRKERRVILTLESIKSALTKGVLKQTTGIELPHFAALLGDSFIQKLETFKQLDNKYFVYETDSKGRLKSSDPEALFYLLCYHASSQNMKETLFYLNQFETLARHHELPKELQKSIQEFNVAAAASCQPELIRVSLRLAAAIHENNLLHEKKGQKDEADLNWKLLGLIANLTAMKSYQNSSGNVYRIGISEYQELFVLNSIVKTGKDILALSMPKDTPPSLSKALAIFGYDLLPSVLSCMPELSKRHDYLKSKYQLSGEEETSQARIFLESFVLGNSPEHQEGKITLPGLIEEWYSTRDAGEIYDYDDTLKLIYNSLDLASSFDNLPVSFSEINSDLILKYFHLYYQLALGEIPKEIENDEIRKELFFEKSKEFKRTLSFMKGSEEDKLKRTAYTILCSASEHPEYFSANLFQDFFNQYRIFLDEKEAYNNSLNTHPANSINLVVLEGKIENFRDNFANQLKSLCALSSIKVTSPQLRALLKEKAINTLKLSGKTYLMSKLGLGTLNAVHQAALWADSAITAGIDVYIHNVKTAAAKTQMEMTQQADLPLADALQTELQKEDEHYSKVFENFFKDNFILDIHSPTQTTSKLEKFRSPTKTKLYRNSFRKMQKSLQDYYKRPRSQEVWRYKSYENLFILESQLDTTYRDLHRHLKNEKHKILDFIQKRSYYNQTDTQAIQQEVQLKFSKKYERSEKEIFNTLLKAFLENDYKQVFKISNLTEKEIPQLESMLYHYLCKSTRMHQMERCLAVVKILQATPQNDKQEIKIRLEQLAFELRRSRTYNFNIKSSRLLKGFLVFEYRSKKMLWDKQSKQLQRMLLGPKRRTVLEQIMGSGKTFLIPVIDYFAANGKRMLINVWPAPLAVTNTSQNSHHGRKNFDQESFVLKITRKLKLGIENLWAYLRVFQRAIEGKEQINTTKEDLQALDLRFFEAIHNRIKGGNTIPSNEELSSYKNLLKMIREKGIGSIDEAHRAFRRKDELNYPLGKKKTLPKNWVLAIEECVRVGNKYINFKDNKQSYLKAETYKKEILPLIATDLSKSNLFKLPRNDRELFAQYIAGNLSYIPDFVLNHPKKEEMALMKGVLTKIDPLTCLENCIINVTCGPSHAGYGEGAKPYDGNENPVETATIQNPFEAQKKTYQMFLHNRLSDDQAKRLLIRLNELAEKEARRSKGSVDKTRIARIFSQWCTSAGHENLDLSEFSKEKLKNNPNKELLKNVFEILKNEDEAIFTYVRLMVPTEYFELNLKNNSLDFASMFPAFYSYTGTANKDGVFPFRSKVLWDKGTLGESLDLLCKMCASPDTIFKISGEKPRDCLNNITQILDQNKKISSVIDQGAIFRGLDNETVAKTLVNYIQTSREDMDGIVFYNKDNELMMWEKNAPKPIPFAESSIPLERRLTYYDQSHTYGADIPQPFGGIGFVIIGEHVDTLEYTQAYRRMRGLSTANQKIFVGMHDCVSDLIVGVGKKPTIRQTIEFARMNEAKATAEDNYLSDRQKIFNVIKTAVRDKIICAETIGETLTVATEFYSLFITENKLSPFAMYGNPEEEMDPIKALKELKDKQFKLIKDSSSFTAAEKTAIRKELDAIVQAVYPETVSVYKDTEHNKVVSIELGLTQQNEVEQDQSQENDQEIERETEVEQEQDQSIEIQEGIEDREKAPRLRLIGAKWDSDFDYFSSKTWLRPTMPSKNDDNQKVKIHRLSDLLKTAQTPAIAQSADNFHGRLLCTNNFAGILTNGSLAKFSGPRQKPVREILVLEVLDEKGSKHVHTCALDEQDVTFWRTKFEQDRKYNRDLNPKIKIALFDVHSFGTIDTGKHALTTNVLKQNKVFIRHVGLWKMFNGNCTYTPEELKALDQWLEIKDRRQMHEAFLDIHKLRSLEPFKGSHVETLFLSASDLIG